MNARQLRSKNWVIIAVDSGIKFTRVTYGFLTWGADGDFTFTPGRSLRFPSVLRYNCTTRAVSTWGSAAQEEPTDKSQTASCIGFKKFLCNDLVVKDDRADGRYQPVWERDPIYKDSKTVFADLIESVFSEITKGLRDEGTASDLEDCQLLVSWPEYFSDEDAEILKGEIVLRFPKVICHFFQEGLAAATHAIDQLKTRPQGCDIHNLTPEELKTTAIILCDAGVSIKIVPFSLRGMDGTIQPVATPDKGTCHPYGGKSIDDAIRRIIREEIPDTEERRAFSNSPTEYKLIQEFVDLVLSSASTDFKPVRLGLQHVLKNLHSIDGSVVFDSPRMTTCLEKCVEAAVGKLKACIGDCGSMDNLSVKYIFLTGALGIFPPFIKEMDRNFLGGNIRVVEIEEGDWAVSQGMIKLFLQDVTQAHLNSARANYRFGHGNPELGWFLEYGQNYKDIQGKTYIENISFNHRTQSYQLRIVRDSGVVNPNPEVKQFDIFPREIKGTSGNMRFNLPKLSSFPKTWKFAIQLSNSNQTLIFEILSENGRDKISQFSMRDE